MWINDYVEFYAADRTDLRDRAWIAAEWRAITRAARRARVRRIAARAREAISGAVGERIAEAAVGWFRRRRIRADLEGLSERMQADIGIARAGIPVMVRAAYRRPHDRRVAYRSTERAEERDTSAVEEAAPAKAA